MFFTNGDAEANENAVRMARLHGLAQHTVYDLIRSRRLRSVRIRRCRRIPAEALRLYLDSLNKEATNHGR